MIGKREDLGMSDNYMLHNLWLHMCHMAVLTADRKYNRTVGDQVFTELARVPVYELPTGEHFVEQWWRMIDDYIKYAYQTPVGGFQHRDGGYEIKRPDWFKEEWVSKNW